MTFTSSANFTTSTPSVLRSQIIPTDTDAFRICHGAADKQPGLYLEKLGPWLLCQSTDELTPDQEVFLADQASAHRAQSIYFKHLERHVRGQSPQSVSPHLLSGVPEPGRFEICENGVRYELSFTEGYSVGLFLDQRDNRRRFLKRHVGPDFELPGQGTVLNTFAYTCAFSVCAAFAGYQTVSLDLSKKYLEWGKGNFALNNLPLDGHDFIFGDVFEWLRRLEKKGRRFQIIILDPPTFSQSKSEGMFRAEKDFGNLVQKALPLLAPSGVLLASTNAARLAPELFLQQIQHAVASSGRKILRSKFIPQPIDFPITREEPGYLKTCWLQVN